MSITKMIAGRFTNYDDRESAGSRFRAKRIGLLLEMMKVVHAEHGLVNVIDIGGTEQYWKIVPEDFLREFNVKITIVNLPGTATQKDHDFFTFTEADGCDLTSIHDKSFHIAHSNSVVEHVGDWERMTRFAREVSRVSQRYFVQTPNYWFPIEPHFMTPFIHWLPRPMRVWLVLRFALGNMSRANSVDQAVRIVESARLLNKKMFAELFKDADVTTETYLGLSKSFIATR